MIYNFIIYTGHKGLMGLQGLPGAPGADGQKGKIFKNLNLCNTQL